MKINNYWMCKSDQWLILPSLRITIETMKGMRRTSGYKDKDWLIVGFEIGFLKKWCAIEFIID